MPQKNTNIQTQEQQQVLQLTPQQVLQVRLLEMPIQELEQRIEKELLDNEGLEKGPEENLEVGDSEQDIEADNSNDYEGDGGVLEDKEDGDYGPTEPRIQDGKTHTAFESLPFSNEDTFGENLKNQIAEFDVTERQRELLEYLIGYLETDGFCRKALWQISDELSIYFNIETSEQELEECLHILQQFDPAGIGARNLQECLLLQIERKENDTLLELKRQIIQNCFEEFCHNNWDKIPSKLNVSKLELAKAVEELRKLNPRPGVSLGESETKNHDTIIPDFYVSVEDDGTIHVQLNNEHLPQLHISQSFSDSLNEYVKNKNKMEKNMREQMAYIKSRIDSAQGFIAAIKSRQTTMLNTMKSIIFFQQDFFLDGDDMSIKPLTMKMVAERAKVDISTVSRVCNSKYVETPYGIYPLKYFFGDNLDGVATRIIRAYLKEVIENEDKGKPLTDDQLSALLKENKGYDVARRTIAKYRAQLGIPVARMRKN